MLECETYAATATAGGCSSLSWRRAGSWVGVGAAAARSNSDVGGTGAVVTLGRDDLVIVASQFHVKGRPCVEVGTDIDGTASTVVGADRPVLLEGRRPLDGWLVGAGRLEDLVGTAVHCDGTLCLCSRGGVVVAEALNDVVLNQWVLGPAVDG